MPEIGQLFRKKNKFAKKVLFKVDNQVAIKKSSNSRCVRYRRGLIKKELVAFLRSFFLGTSDVEHVGASVLKSSYI